MNINELVESQQKTLSRLQSINDRLTSMAEGLIGEMPSLGVNNMKDQAPGIMGQLSYLQEMIDANIIRTQDLVSCLGEVLEPLPKIESAISPPRRAQTTDEGSL